MARILKATYSDSNECEVTGKVSHWSVSSEIILDDTAPGRKVFPDNPHNFIYGELVIGSVSPTGVTIVNPESHERYIVKEGEEYSTGIYTSNGRYRWWYTFEIGKTIK